jgi:hypothetical protein
MIDPKYVPAVPAVKRAFDSYSDFCQRVGVQCPTFEAYAKATRSVSSVPISGGLEKPVRHPKQRT